MNICQVLVNYYILFYLHLILHSDPSFLESVLYLRPLRLDPSAC